MVIHWGFKYEGRLISGHIATETYREIRKKEHNMKQTKKIKDRHSLK